MADPHDPRLLGNAQAMADVGLSVCDSVSGNMHQPALNHRSVTKESIMNTH